MLISTGAAELVLFALSLLSGLPLPLLAVQLLWLNLVTNGIQDVALAFEPGEGDELKRPPRRPNERIFNRLMIERVLISALVMGGTAFLLFRALLESGMDVDSARNSVLLLMVLFENVHAFNSRSETRSVFRHNPLRNRPLLVGHIGGAVDSHWRHARAVDRRRASSASGVARPVGGTAGHGAGDAAGDGNPQTGEKPVSGSGLKFRSCAVSVQENGNAKRRNDTMTVFC